MRMGSQVLMSVAVVVCIAAVASPAPVTLTANDLQSSYGSGCCHQTCNAGTGTACPESVPSGAGTVPCSPGVYNTGDTCANAQETGVRIQKVDVCGTAFAGCTKQYATVVSCS